MNTIDRYDEGLTYDITRLEVYIDKQEEEAKQQMEMDGCPREAVELITEEHRAKGEHLPSTYFVSPASLVSDELLRALRDLHQVIKHFPFRIYFKPTIVSPIFHDPLSIQVITKDGESWLNTTTLTANERKTLVEHISKVIDLNMYWGYYSMEHCYPTVELMRYTSEMLMKYKMEHISSNNNIDDKAAQDLLREIPVE